MARKQLARQRHSQAVELVEGTAATPAAGFVSLFGDADGLVSVRDDSGGFTALAGIVQTGTGSGRRVFVQLDGEAAPTGMVAGDILIAEVSA